MLNEQQKKVVDFFKGQCVVTATAGSGKTMTVTERVASLIEKGVNPSRILCLTFTNKAGMEMNTRICEKLGVDSPNFYIGTFHSLCVKILKKYCDRIGYEKGFSIFDDDDQAALMKHIFKEMGYTKAEEKKFNIRSILYKVNMSREMAETEEQMADRFEDAVDLKLAQKYLLGLKEQNAFDFSGLLFETISLLENNADIREKLQDMFEFIQVDEMQDTNYAQFKLINLFAGKHKNIVLTGDTSQCVISGTKILTDIGEIEIDKLTEGNLVLAGRGSGKLLSSKILHYYKRDVTDYPVVTITTCGGREITTTREHIHFADFINKDSGPDCFYVYLMYKKGYGYRMGVTRKYAHGKNKIVKFGFKGRTSQESANKIWIIRLCDNEKDARYWEQYYSVSYGIPTWVFRDRNMGGSSYTQEQIDKLFANVDTNAGAEKLLKKEWLFFDYPHHIPKCCNNDRYNFSVIMCADSRGGSPGHFFSISGSETDDGDLLKKEGLNIRQAKKCIQGSWRVEGTSTSLSKIKDIFQKIPKTIDVSIIEKARLFSTALKYTPASHVLPGMSIYVSDGKNVFFDKVLSVKRWNYSGSVYDIDVDKCHNYIANGIAVHNSIYRFRGARIENVSDFMSMYPDCIEIHLGQNYRSTPQIIRVSEKLIKHNKSFMGGDFTTENADGEEPTCDKHYSSREEAESVASKIKYYIEEEGWEPSEIVVLYRLNRLSLEIQSSLGRNGIPFAVIGGPGFFDRREIKDCVAMLKWLSNPKDKMAFHRVIDMFGGIGETTYNGLVNIASKEGLSLMQACEKIDTFSNRKSIIEAAKSIKETFTLDTTGMHAGQALSSLISRVKYEDKLRSISKNDGEFQDRQGNVSELINNATLFGQKNSSIDAYLQNMALISSADKNSGDVVTLQTLHSAKGLEYGIVFVIGAEEGIMPHSLALSDAKSEDDAKDLLEEERRTMYVGLSRAKKHLHVSYSSVRSQNNWGKVSFVDAYPSRFLYEAGLVKKWQI